MEHGREMMRVRGPVRFTLSENRVVNTLKADDRGLRRATATFSDLPVK
jgi:hypothetical protein